ncbi:Bromodomain [Phytophthora infestans]|uniref:Bromodomain n=1 Tax=Phytophthora infestans TaxID=4787 RepID=A0A833T4U1_PHYIN|nr:Bromodomain [Phytophthora infestans]KAF4140333.1 Bromodomain [Phytophthora infestans]
MFLVNIFVFTSPRRAKNPVSVVLTTNLKKPPRQHKPPTAQRGSVASSSSMYHGAPRDRGDKKRQRLTPPPNEVWMEAIMSKGKTPDGYIPASAVTASGVATSSAAGWQGRARAPSDYPQASGPQGPVQYPHYSTAPSYQGRPVERRPSYQGRAPETYQGRPMDPGYQARMVDGAATYQGRTVDGPNGYQGRATPGPVYQGRAMENSAGYQSRPMDAGYQERMEPPPGYQERPSDGPVVYQGRLVQGSPAYQGRVADGSAGGKSYQGRMVETSSSSGKMAEDYKRERKLPPRVEEMLREQVNLDESVLHDAYAVAMEDLIPEEEANFVAKGLCHLCGASDSQFMPVVNFCPHGDEQHSLCREHLRSVYRVRLEALFVGRNGSAPNRRLLRCLICTRGCPCTRCTAEKGVEVQKYKRYLMDTLRRSGQGALMAPKDDRVTAVAAAKAALSAPASDGRLTYGSAPSTSSSDGRRYAQYPPTPPAEARPPMQRDGLPARSVEAGKAYDVRRQMQLKQAESDKEQTSRDGYSPSMQAQPKSPSPVPKRAAKDTSSGMLAVMAESAQASDPRVAARVASPKVAHAESPSAATVLNCAESEKSLVQLLSSLNQGGTPASSAAMDASSQSSKDSSQRPSDARYTHTNGIAARSGSSGNTQSSGDTEMEASPRTFAGRGIADRRRPDKSPYQDQSSTSSDESDSPRRPTVGARPLDQTPTRKRKISDSTAEDSPTPRGSEDISSRDASKVVRRNDSAAKEQSNDKKPQHKAQASPKLSAKSGEKEITQKPERKESHTTTPPPHRGPGRPRKHPLPEGVAPPVRKNAQKPAPPVKRGRGRPPKRPKRVKQDDEETEDESFRQEDDEGQEDDSGSDSELDANLDFCEVCQGAGDLVCCDKCPRSYHLKCLHMTENDLPEGDWQCAECKKPSRFDGYSTAVAAEQNLLDRCLKIVACLKSHPFSKPFLTPVENVPMYTRVVKQPMDLSKIENKLKKGAYVVDSNMAASGAKKLDVTHFANDIRLMWSNCKLFNDDGSGITRAADILSAGFERLYKESVEPPLTS